MIHTRDALSTDAQGKLYASQSATRAAANALAYLRNKFMPSRSMIALQM